MSDRPGPMAGDATSAAIARSPRLRSHQAVRRVVAANELTLIAVLIALSVGFGLKNSLFWSSANMRSIALATSFMLIVAVAETLVLISGSLDLSVGSVYALGGVITGMALTHGASVAVAIAAGIGAGAGVGIVNACAIVYLRVPALIATLGSLYAVRGIVLVLTSGNAVYPLPNAFVRLGSDSFLSFPIPVWIALAAVVVGQVTLARTVFGRQLYAIGGNDRAAFLNGLPIIRLRFAVFMITGAAAALGGILVSAWISSSQVNSGTGLELSVIAAVIIGGTSLYGGSGTVVGTLLGALLISVINAGMVLAEIDPFYQNIVVGVIIVLAVAVDGWRRRRNAERQ